MDAMVFLRDRTTTHFRRVLFCFVCLLPIVGGVISRALHHAWAFMDIDAVLCAAKVEAAGSSPYGALACPGLAPAPYVYAPQVAASLGPWIHVAGAPGAHWIYIICLYIPACLALAWYALGRGLPGVDWRYRMLAISGLSPMAFCSGNFGMVLHAAVIFSFLNQNDFGRNRPSEPFFYNASCRSKRTQFTFWHGALVWPKRKWAFTGLVLACSVVKPTFLLYFFVVLFERRPWRDRLLVLAVSGAAGVLVIVATALTAGPLGAAWGQALRSVTLHNQPGMGWFAFTTWLGLAANAPVTVVLTLLFMAAMLASGLGIAEAAGLDDNERKVLALGLVPLLTPRLMDYDMLALAPCVALLMRVTPALGGRIYCYNMSWIFVGVLGFGAANNVLHLHRWPRCNAAAAVFCAVVLVGGARLAMKKWGKDEGRSCGKKGESPRSVALFISGELQAARTHEEGLPDNYSNSSNAIWPRGGKPPRISSGAQDSSAF